MELSRKDVEYVAGLARLELGEEEKDTLTLQLGHILAYVEKLGELDTGQVEPTSHVLPLQNVLREDEVVPPRPPEEMLSQAPESEKGHYKVPRVIAEAD